LREIYELGIIFRGFVIVSHVFKEVPSQKETKVTKDLRAAFISALNTFAGTAFDDNSLEYLDSGNVLFILKNSKVKSQDGVKKETIIMYGLVEKKKKDEEKYVKKFFNKINPLLENFIQAYENRNFTELTQFNPFEKELMKIVK